LNAIEVAKTAIQKERDSMGRQTVELSTALAKK